MTTETYELIIVDTLTYAKARLAAEKGWKDAQLTLMLVNRTLGAMQDHPMECICGDCTTLMDNKATVPKAFVVFIPMFPRAGCEAVSCGVCEFCVDRPDLRERTVEALRKICPSATLMEPMGPVQ